MRIAVHGVVSAPVLGARSPPTCIDLLAVLAALGLLMYLAYRAGISLLILAPAMALLAATNIGKRLFAFIASR